MADVFLSYKREDAARVRKLVDALRSVGLDVWWDEDIPASAPWEATIEKALASAKAVIVCWSPASVASENVRSEARVAREDGRLIQVFVKPCAAPLFFGERQGVDLAGWRGNARDRRIGEIVECVRQVAGEAAAAPSQSRAKSGLRWSRRAAALSTAAALVVLLGGGLFAWRSAMARPTPELAVLPFEDLSPTHDKAYFAQGVAEEILSSLATDRQIKVLGRTSARQIDPDADPREIRKSLGVTQLLEGSTRTAGNDLRVNVRLIDTRDGTTMWQDEYRGHLSDVFSVQDRIASSVVHRLRGMFAQPAPALVGQQQTSAEAYQNYLAARAIMRARTKPTLQRALALARQVVAADPTYAPGQALVAELIFMLSNGGNSYGDIPVQKARAMALPYAQRAVRLSPNTADGYAALGLLLPPAQAVAPLRKAIALDPSRAELRDWLEIADAQLGRYDEEMQQAQLAVETEPLWSITVNGLVLSYGASGRTADALRTIERFEAMGGDRAQALRFRASVAAFQGNLARSIAYARQALKLNPAIPYVGETLAIKYHILGLPELAKAAVSQQDHPLDRLLVTGQSGLIVERVRSAGPELLNSPELDVAVFASGAARDWGSLVRLYRLSAMTPEQFCASLRRWSLPVAEALRATGEVRNSQAIIDCVQRQLQNTFKQSSRSKDDSAGQAEFDEARVLGVAGNRNGAIAWLKRAIGRGWTGYPYSPHFIDWPELDVVRGDSRVAAMQARVDRTLADQRAQVLAQGL